MDFFNSRFSFLYHSLAANSLLFGILLVLCSLLLALSSDILIYPTFSINSFLDPVRTLLMGVVSVLLAANLTLVITKLHKPTLKAAAGGIFSFGVSSCVVCQPLWFFWLGLGSSTLFLLDIATPLAALSALFLGISLLQGSTNTCELRKTMKGQAQTKN